MSTRSTGHVTRMAAKKFNVVFVLGGPGAGKGTQCTRIVKEFGYVHLSAGDLLRAERQRDGSQFGSLIQEHIKNGTIVPVKITCALLRRAMEDSEKQNFLIDGFPRNEDNRLGWEREMNDHANIKCVLFFDCEEQVCINRCLKRGETSGRADDNEESLKKRIHTYVNNTKHIIDHYSKLDLVKKVNAALSEEEVFTQVKKCFD